MTAMLPDAVSALIRDEQRRTGGHFIVQADLDGYLAKLARHADVLADTREGRCLGLVAFYANDTATGRAFITLVLVAPEARGGGLGSALVSGALAICRARGMATCRLEVRHDNAAALATYRRLGFVEVEDRGDRMLMEAAL